MCSKMIKLKTINFEGKKIVVGNRQVSTYSNSNKSLNDFRSKFSSHCLKFIAYDLKWNEEKQKYDKINILKFSGTNTCNLSSFDAYIEENGGRSHIGIEIKLTDTNKGMIDFDGKNHTIEWINQNYPFLKNHKPFPGNTRGFHYFVENDKLINSVSNQDKIGEKIDYCHDCCFLPIYQYEAYTNYKIKQISDDELNLLSPVILSHMKKEEVVNSTQSLIDDIPVEIVQQIYNYNNLELNEILEILDDKRADEGRSWSLILSALASKDLKDMAYKFSKRSNKHTDSEFEEKWNKSLNHTNSIGIIYNYAKIDNPDKYRKIRKKFKYEGLVLTITDFETTSKVAYKIADFLKTSLVFSQEKWWTPINNIWRNIGNNAGPIISDVIERGKVNYDNELNDKINYLLLDDDDNQDKIKEINATKSNLLKARKAYDKPGSMSMIINELKILLEDDDFEDKLDSLKFALPFKNGILCLKTKILRHGLFDDDYISKIIEYDWNEDEIKEEDTNWINEKLMKIFHTEEFYNYYLSYIGMSFCNVAERCQKVMFNVGQGSGNGKTTVVNVLSMIAPKMVGTMDSKVIELNYAKAHKFLPILSKYLLVYIEEFPAKKTDPEIFKRISEGRKISNEVMFGTNKDIKVKAKVVINTNYTPEFNIFDAAVKRRYAHSQFDSRFVKENDPDAPKVCPEKRIYSMEETLVEDMAKKTMSFLNIIVDFAVKYANKLELEPCPQEFEDEKQQVAECNNKFKTWFNDNIEIDEDFIELKENIILEYKLQTGDIVLDRFLRDTLKGMGYKYDRQRSLGGRRGIYVGFKLKKTAPPTPDNGNFINDEEDVLGN